MVPEWAHVAVDALLIPTLAFMGWLLNRAISSVDAKLAKIEADLTSTVGTVNTHNERLAVIEFRLNHPEK